MQKTVRKFQTAYPELVLPQERYAIDAVSDEIEQAICQSLPPMPELGLDMTDAERLAVFEASVSASYAKFVALHGGPFGDALHISSMGENGGRFSLVRSTAPASTLPLQATA